MSETIEQSGNVYLANAKILFKVATVENAFNRTYKLLALTPEEIPVMEPKLLEEARALLPRIMPTNCDMLMVDRMGKTSATRAWTPMSPNFLRTAIASAAMSAPG